MNITLKKNKEIRLNDIVLKITEGDRRAFRELYDLFYDKVFRFVHYFIANNEDCEEVVSEVFCAIWGNRKSLMQVKNLEAYIYVVSRNEAYHFVKKRNNTVLTIDEMPVDLFVQEDSIEHLLIAEELLQTYQKVVSELPERCKLIFLMVREEHLKYKEIAQVLSISEGTIESQMNIAIKKLVSALNQNYPSLRIKQRYS